MGDVTRSTECNKWHLGIFKERYAGIIMPGRRNDQCINQTSRYNASKIFCGVLVAGAWQHDKVQAMTSKYILHPIADGHEKVVTVGGRSLVRLDHEPHGAGCALTQGSPRLVGHIAELGGPLENTLSSISIDVEAAVKCLRHSAHRQIQMAGQSPDTLHNTLQAGL